MINGVRKDLSDNIRVIDSYTFVTLQDLHLIGLDSEMVDDIVYIYPEKVETEK